MYVPQDELRRLKQATEAALQAAILFCDAYEIALAELHDAIAGDLIVRNGNLTIGDKATLQILFALFF